MSLVNSVGYAFYAANRFVPKQTWGGKMKPFLDEYEAAALADGSTITMFLPPKGAKWNGVGAVWSDNLGNNTTLAVGIAGATTKFGAATNHGGGAAVKTLLGLAADIDAVGYEFDGETPVIITTGTGAGTGTIKLYMEFLLPG